jgi:hypothetical protein
MDPNFKQQFNFTSMQEYKDFAKRYADIPDFAQKYIHELEDEVLKLQVILCIV